MYATESHSVADRNLELSMLLPILFIVAVLTVVASTTLEAGFLGAKAAAHERATRYAEIGTVRSVADYTDYIARYVKANGTEGVWPPPAVAFYPESACTVPTGSACPFTLTTAARFSANSTSSKGGGPGGADSANDEQQLWIREHRISAAVQAVVTGTDGSLLATRTRLVTMRVFGTAPYATVVGVRDIESSTGGPIVAQGDSGGTAPSHESRAKRPNPNNPDAFSDTRIQMHLACRRWQSGTGIHNTPPGNERLPWGVQNTTGAFEIECTQGDSDIGTYGREHWDDGDRGSSSWSR
jgi:hypothetical protein